MIQGNTVTSSPTGRTASWRHSCGSQSGISATLKTRFFQAPGRSKNADDPFYSLTPFLQTLPRARESLVNEEGKEYLECIEKLYKLKPENLDFKNNLEEARMQITSWFENKTKGEIQTLLSPSSLTGPHHRVLVNTITVPFRKTTPKQWLSGWAGNEFPSDCPNCMFNQVQSWIYEMLVLLLNLSSKFSIENF
ncbi:hypothetical protein PANDA_016053 [Ailuropoda melanoleuca]|uniref:Serpin domain-containing protein n=1 Tax=Ailuropoda melanoleuca TaxID=9646 RepID=D2HUT1_AILME|nr:hypothetical protein PANDA_016053 [Ailuropoda melanoleuca]